MVQGDASNVYQGYAVSISADGNTATERYYLRDQLDRKSAIIPQLVAQGLAIADMQARRALYPSNYPLATA
jgi:hypothetical protein